MNKAGSSSVNSYESNNALFALEPFREEICLKYLKQGLKKTLRYIRKRHRFIVSEHELFRFLSYSYIKSMAKSIIEKYATQEKLKKIHKEKGLSGLRCYIYHQYGLKLSNRLLRDLIGVRKNYMYKEKVGVHRLAWTVAGYNGKMPNTADPTKINLISAGLLQKEQKMLIQ